MLRACTCQTLPRPYLLESRRCQPLKALEQQSSWGAVTGCPSALYSHLRFTAPWAVSWWVDRQRSPSSAVRHAYPIPAESVISPPQHLSPKGWYSWNMSLGWTTFTRASWQALRLLQSSAFFTTVLLGRTPRRWSRCRKMPQNCVALGLLQPPGRLNLYQLMANSASGWRRYAKSAET